MTQQRIVAFDAGITHVGMVEARADLAWQGLCVTRARCIDIARVAHDRVPREECTLKHDNTLASRFAHFLQENRPTIDAAAVVLVEQQPPGSAGQVFEQLLLYAVPRTQQVHPRSVHKFFGHGHLDYRARKRAAERAAAPLLGTLAVGAARMHDIADATCLLIYTAEKRRREAVAAVALSELQQFAFTGPLPPRVGGRALASAARNAPSGGRGGTHQAGRRASGTTSPGRGTRENTSGGAIENESIC